MPSIFVIKFIWCYYWFVINGSVKLTVLPDRQKSTVRSRSIAIRRVFDFKFHRTHLVQIIFEVRVILWTTIIDVPVHEINTRCCFFPAESIECMNSTSHGCRKMLAIWRTLVSVRLAQVVRASAGCAGGSRFDSWVGHIFQLPVKVYFEFLCNNE